VAEGPAQERGQGLLAQVAERSVAQVVAEARRRYDEELLAFIDPDAVDAEDIVDDE